jgi:hypothetical protein
VQANKDLTEILKKCAEAAERGAMHCRIDAHFTDQILEIMVALGYDVDESETAGGIQYSVIHWSN